MAYKTAFVGMAPEADPKKHRATVKTPKLEHTVVLVGLMNIKQAIDVCKELAQKDGIQSITLCAGFSHDAVGKIASAVGERVAINVARPDVASAMITSEILAKEGLLPERH